MADARQSSAGVKNLRAMFENSAPSTPDSRGRSVSGNSSNGSSERPLSKVRSSFVAVEPSASSKMTTSTTSTTSTSPSVNIKDRQRRESFSLSEETDAEAIEEIHKTISEEEAARRSSKDVVEVIPENAIETAPPTAVATPLLTAIGKKPQITPEPATKQIGKGKAAQSLKSTSAQTSRLLSTLETAKEEPAPQQLKTENAPEPKINGHKLLPIDLLPEAAISHVPLSPPLVDGPSEEQVPAQTTPSQNFKSEAEPEVQDSPSGPIVPRTYRAGTRTPSTSGPVKPAPRTSSAQPNGTRNRQPSQARSTRSSLASNTTLPGNLDRGVGFVKPRPRSPTRPIKLPAHLVAPTASSASKVRGADSPIPPTSPGGAATRPNGASASRAGVGPRPSFGPRTPVRNAWGPPPARKPSVKPKEPPRRESREPDRGFLERMMRPTASSAAKERGAENAVP